MNRLSRLRQALLRWDRLLSAVAVGLPFAVMTLLGFVWLLEHGWLLWFVLASLALGVVIALARRISRRPTDGERTHEAQQDAFAVHADPDWLDAEQAAFADACRYVESVTQAGLGWEAVPDTALAVATRVTRHLGGEKKTALEFSAPEALLLIETTASRYRRHLRQHLPFSDQVSIATMYWLWRQRDRLGAALKLADGGRRLARMAINPTRGIVQEVERLVAGGHSDYLSGEMMATMQAILLEEVAFAAVELYSGRLRFSDAELLDIELATTAADRARLAQPDEPIRILLVGQISAGKSTLLNALLEIDRAETDVAPTTAGFATYETLIDDVAVHLLDSAGIDDSSDNRGHLREEMCESDLILWLVRADRPARRPDRLLLDAYNDWFAQHPARRKPRIIFVATAMDTLAPQWPLPEHNLPTALQQKFASAVSAIASDLDANLPIPVSSVSPPWNIDTVCIALESAIGEAMMAQRNRRRIQASGDASGLRNQFRRGRRGIITAARLMGGRLFKRRTQQARSGDPGADRAG